MPGYYGVVIFDRPIDPLTYSCAREIAVGSIVQVPLGRQSCTGIVVESSSSAPNFKGRIRSILEIVDPVPFISQALMTTLRFMSAYYAVPLGFCLKLALPGGMMRSGKCYYFEGIAPENGSAQIEDIYQLLRSEPNGMTETEIRKQVKISDEQFESWVLDGSLVAQWTLDKSRMSETKEMLYEAVPGSTSKKLGSKQQALLDYINESETPVRHSEILEKFGSCNPVLHRLEELGLIRLSVTTRDKSSFDDIQPIVHEFDRTDEQIEAINRIVNHEGFGSFLLFGVTGSGKTEVYLGVMEAVRKRGQGCIFVLPEIALTPQFCAVFRGRFGDDVAVLHSGLGDHERFDTWCRIRAGRMGIAIGPRSALFAPVQNLGLIVIDEEHDGSFKQGETPRYHARDMALYLGQQAKCPVILGSATPSLESYSRALQGRMQLLTLTRRPMARPMPEVSIVDMRNRTSPEIPSDLDPSEKIRLELRSRLLSDELADGIRDTLDRHEQAMIFLNRRGFSTFIQCNYCGHVLYCPNCDVALTYYKYSNHLHCHYCDYESKVDEICPKCGRSELAYTGYGTERLVDVLQAEFPSARIDRLDRDRASTRGIRNVLDSFRNGELDILVGTQMIAKGHDIHNVTLVGIVNADMSLHMPDFRASERTFQLLAQVSGRAGRGARPGRVILQTLKPEHPAILATVSRDYVSFAIQELGVRRALDNPPFASLVMLRFDGDNPMETETFAIQISRMASNCRPDDGKARLLGPAPAPIPMLCGKMRYQLYMKHDDRGVLHRWLVRLMAISSELRTKMDTHVKCIVDVDPYDML